MKSRSGMFILSMAIGSASFSQCVIDFSHVDNWDTLSFTNLSIVPNAHYYWNFGDGSTSYDASPGHVFPAAGHYLVTLYGLDTVSQCHGYHEQWIDVAIQSTDPCQPMFTDTVVTSSGNELLTMDITSMDCDDYWPELDAGPGQNAPLGTSFWLSAAWGAQLWVNRLEYYSQSPVEGFPLKAEYYRTRPNHYDRAVNYDTCSANFEFHVTYEADSALVSFTAMSPVGVDTFEVIGFGNPDYIGSSEGSHHYPYDAIEQRSPWLISLRHTHNGCATASTQTVMIEDPGFVPAPPCTIYAQPSDQAVLIGDTARFIIQSEPGVPKQWQRNTGLFWNDLSNTGPYSGVHTDTLTIANVQPSFDNNQFRCLLGDGYLIFCYNTSDTVTLTTMVGIEEMGGLAVQVFPIPAHDRLNLGLDPSAIGAVITIRNTQGQVVRTGVVETAEMALDVEDLVPGVYLLVFQGSSGVGRARFVKQ